MCKVAYMIYELTFSIGKEALQNIHYVKEHFKWWNQKVIEDVHVKKGEKGEKESSWVKRGNLPPTQD